DRSIGGVAARREDVEALRKRGGRIAVTHPAYQSRPPDSPEYSGVRLDGQGRLAVLSLGGAPHLPTVGSHHELIPVADTQERNTALEEILVRVRGGGSVDARGAPREDNHRHPPALQSSQRSVVRQQLRVDAERSDATAYEMRVLAAEIEDDDSAAEQVGSQLTHPGRGRESGLPAQKIRGAKQVRSWLHSRGRVCSSRLRTRRRL